MKSKMIIFIAAIALVGTLAALAFESSKSDTNPVINALPVTASFYPMAEFSRQVGGNNIRVDTLVTQGVEPHDYEPSPKDLVELRKSKLFVYNGAGLEPWLEKLTAGLPKDSVTLSNASDGLKLLPQDEHEEEEVEEHAEELTDPHVWLDPVLAQQQVQNISKSLAAVNPENADEYKTNADVYIAKLAALDQEYKTGLAHCERRSIVTSHQAFRYLAARYDIDITSINGLSPEEEPSPQKLAEVAEFAKTNDVRYIFFETLASPKLSETIAREIVAKTLVLNPLEGLTDAEVAADADYISVQKQNLSNLRLAMGCK